MSHVKPIRSWAKAISWRVIGSTLSAYILFQATGSGKIALSFGVVETVVKIIMFYLHERAWDRIAFGKMEAENGHP